MRCRASYRLPFFLALLGIVYGLLIGRLSYLNAGMLLLLTLTAIGSFFEPLIGIGIALFLGPFWAWLRAQSGPLPPLIGQYVFVLTVGIWVMRGLLRRSLYLPHPPLLAPLLLFMGVALLSLWRPADVGAGAWEWAKWLQILLMFLLVYARLTERDGSRRMGWLIVALAVAAGFQALLGLWQFGLSSDVPEHFAIDARFYRAYGTFEQPNPYAGFLGLIGALLAGLVLAAVWDWPAGGRWRKVDYKFGLLLFASVATGAGLLASWSRGGWMGFVAAVLGIVALLPRRRGWGIALLMVVLIGGLGLYAVDLLPASIAARLTGFLEYSRFADVRGVGINDTNYAVIERMAHWQAALSMWRAHFWLGVGFGCYEAAYPTYRLINWPLALGHAHNYYLNLLAESGILGLLAYLVLLGCVLARLWRVSRRMIGRKRGLALGLIGAWTHFVAHNFVDNILVNNVHLHLGVLLALSAWLIEGGEGKDEGGFAGTNA